MSLYEKQTTTVDTSETEVFLGRLKSTAKTMSAIGIQIENSGAALTELNVYTKAHPDASWALRASLEADYTSPVLPMRSSHVTTGGTFITLEDGNLCAFRYESGGIHMIKVTAKCGTSTEITATARES